jgi:hypothetical protein
VCHALLNHPGFFALLARVDADLAGLVWERGCWNCGHRLHRADYPRKPRGSPQALTEVACRRFSFCCSQCRRRSTPPSVVFLGRRVYLGVVVLLGSCRSGGGSAAASAALGNPCRQTLARWRRWWRETFAASSVWRELHARFMPPVSADSLPLGVLVELTGSDEERVLRFLRFLLPLTTRLSIALGEGR